MDEKKKEKNGKLIFVDNEMLEVLEKLRKQINSYGWDALDVTWIDLTRVLARKIKTAGLIK